MKFKEISLRIFAASLFAVAAFSAFAFAQAQPQRPIQVTSPEVQAGVKMLMDPHHQPPKWFQTEIPTTL